MNSLWQMKNFLAASLTGFVAYLSPLHGGIASLLGVFLLNFGFGLLSGLLRDGERFEFRKAWRCVGEAAVFFVLVCAIFVVGRLNGDAKGSLQCVSFVTYSVYYFYCVNILKNLKRLLPAASAGGRVVKFLYYVVSVEFVKHVPFLMEYLQGQQKGKKK